MRPGTVTDNAAMTPQPPMDTVGGLCDLTVDATTGQVFDVTAWAGRILRIATRGTSDLYYLFSTLSMGAIDEATEVTTAPERGDDISGAGEAGEVPGVVFANTKDDVTAPSIRDGVRGKVTGEIRLYLHVLAASSGQTCEVRVHPA